MFYNTALNKQTDKPNFKGWARSLCYLDSWCLKCLLRNQGMLMVWQRADQAQDTEVILKNILGC